MRAGVTEVRERTGWDLQVSADLREIPSPCPSELTTLRGLLATMPATEGQPGDQRD